MEVIDIDYTTVDSEETGVPVEPVVVVMLSTADASIM